MMYVELFALTVQLEDSSIKRLSIKGMVLNVSGILNSEMFYIQ